jgi:Tol biopolymer transport system component
MQSSGTFSSKLHVDSVDVSPSGRKLIIGQSSLEGNIWDGGITLVSSVDGSEIASKSCPAGISSVRFSGSTLILAARDDGNVSLYSADNLEEIRQVSSLYYTARNSYLTEPQSVFNPILIFFP